MLASLLLRVDGLNCLSLVTIAGRFEAPYRWQRGKYYSFARPMQALIVICETLLKLPCVIFFTHLDSLARGVAEFGLLQSSLKSS